MGNSQSRLKPEVDFQFKIMEDVPSSPARAPKSQLAVEQPSARGLWNPPRKDTPRPKTKQKLQQDGRGGPIMINQTLYWPRG